MRVDDAASVVRKRNGVVATAEVSVRMRRATQKPSMSGRSTAHTMQSGRFLHAESKPVRASWQRSTW